MSSWTHLIGTIKVSVFGRTTEENEYVLKTVLKHLPIVSGSERDMAYEVIANKYYDASSGCDEFENITETVKRNRFEIKETFYILVYGNFRDRKFEETYREFQKWLCRLSKRVLIDDVLVSINGYNKSAIITNENEQYSDMFEPFSWSKMNDTHEPNWCEYLLWKKAIGSELPMLLEYKYYENEENDYYVENIMGIKK